MRHDIGRVRERRELRVGTGAYLDMRDLGSSDWDVFDGDGRYQGTLAFPERFTLMKVVGERVYGVVRDDLDIQRVLRIRVSRP